MDEKYSALFTPWKIGNVEIKNRIVMTSMGGTDLFGWMEVNHFDKAGAKFLMEVAKNNVGLVLPGCQPVYNPMLGQWLHKNKKMYDDLAKWMPEFHKTGAKLFVQLTAGFGRSFTVSEVMETLYNNKALRVLSKPFMDLDKITASASPSENRWSDKLPSREMTKAEIQEIIDSFAKSAALLKKAGVVDAGGKGYLVILDGMLRALRGEEIPDVSEEKAESKADFSALSEEEITFTFDTVFIVRKWENTSIEPLRAYLSTIGDCLVIGEDDDAFKVHVHTDIPGAALTEAQKYGTLELAKIENMRTQYEAVAAGRKAQSTDDLDQVEQELESMEEPANAPAEKQYGFLAVCAGEGLATAFRDLGVDRIVSGGQTMNPSTEAILQEVNRTPSKVVFILPNNKNIIMAAQQCVGLTEKQVIVVPTATVPQGITAMMNADLEGDDPQAIADAMAQAAQTVTTAQVTYAARNSDFDGFAINEGDYLALEDGKLFGTDRSIEPLLSKLAEDAKARDAEFVTIFYGEDVTEEDARKAEAVFTDTCPDAEVSVLAGGQPVYYYIVSIE